MDSILSLFSLEGRTNRLGWWGRQFLILIWWAVFIILYAALFGANTEPAEQSDSTLLFWCVAFFGSVGLNLSAMVRRYHDRGKSGLWFLITFIPIVGPIWMLIELGFLSGDRRDNEYGPSLTGAANAFDKAFSEGVVRDSAAEKNANAPKKAQASRQPNQVSNLARCGRTQFGTRGL